MYPPILYTITDPQVATRLDEARDSVATLALKWEPHIIMIHSSTARESSEIKVEAWTRKPDIIVQDTKYRYTMQTPEHVASDKLYFTQQ
ncbi:hypothetical protein CY34DRAFT_732230 [Suillus luteus UH-Slu-Lm8-n1]|uniref:Uncharacterized protein n=1 Tax=Suillus luteus UH-Slu-Lm8-n1 TaxID=930992 RepID=A0A0D0AD26_9AGAM|nr:hypothetical protein CY34DRAFT_732230 [Suillus luteus UH-Slu-Lm8-n1]